MLDVVDLYLDLFEIALQLLLELGSECLEHLLILSLLLLVINFGGHCFGEDF